MEGFIIYVGVLACLWVAGISGLFSALRTPEYVFRAAERSKPGTVVGLLLTCGFGGLYYWLRVRPELLDAARTVSPPPRSDPWDED